MYKRQPLDTTTQREFLLKIHELAPARETYLFVDDYHLVAVSYTHLKAYETMQNQYVLREQDRIEFETAVKALMNIQ